MPTKKAIAKTAINFKRKAHHSNELLLQLYRAILLPRLIEEKMLNMLRMNRISKWFSGIGQEAIAVGVAQALHPNEYVLPMHRNLGVFTGRNIPLSRLFKQWQGKNGGFTKGRDRSFHFGTNDYHIVGMISHLGPQLAVGGGIALGEKLQNQPRVAVAFTGEGGTSEGDFHEALNTAAVWNLPVIFIIENNGYGLSTPSNEQYVCKNLIDRAVGYGMEGCKIDGNNILEVYDTICELAEDRRKNPRPALIECITFRMRGHEEASGTKYVPEELMTTWAKKDPVNNFEQFLLNEGVLHPDLIEAIRSELKNYVNSEVEAGYAEGEVSSTIEHELADVYAPAPYPDTNSHTTNEALLGKPATERRFVEAISNALDMAMQNYPNLILMGQDIAEYGGVFKITDGFVQRYGKQRVRNTTLCESAILGIALGLSIKGFKSMVEMQFADFVSSGFNQIVNNLAKSYYRWGQNADVVIRMPTGGTVGAGPYHSQSNEGWFFQVPGLKIVYPATPTDAKGLLLAALADPNPVLYFEHKALYRSLSEPVADDYFTFEVGKARVAQTGNDISIITYGLGVHWALKTLAAHPNISADVIDLRWLAPLDTEAIFASVRKTGKAIVLHEANLTGNVGAEIAALINQHCFEFLDAPVVRCAAIDTPIPFAPALENLYMPNQRFADELQQLWAY